MVEGEASPASAEASWQESEALRYFKPLQDEVPASTISGSGSNIQMLMTGICTPNSTNEVSLKCPYKRSMLDFGSSPASLGRTNAQVNLLGLGLKPVLREDEVLPEGIEGF